MNSMLKGTLAIVEDSEADKTHYLRLLEESGFFFGEYQWFSSVGAALPELLSKPPQCCLLDYNLPDGNALELLEKISDDAGQIICPIVVITGESDTKTAVELMQLGAQDYLVKQDVSAVELNRAINNAVRTWGLQKQLNYVALHDPLTGLVNRSLFIDRLTLLFDEGMRYKREFALLYIDLDRFKTINDTHGHEAGDYILVQLAELMHKVLRSSDTAARLGGDEFAILLPDINEAKANYLAYKLVQALSFKSPWKNTSLSISPSIGLTCFPSKASSYQELMGEADLALYRAKHGGRGRYSAFDKRLEESSRLAFELSNALGPAILNNELKVAYQPILDVSTGKINCVEALVRWTRNGVCVSPLQLIELVLEQRLGEQFHKWLFEETLGQLKVWQEQNPSLCVSINIPASLCHDGRITRRLLSTAKQKSISPMSIMVEITETHLMFDAEATKRQFDLLAKNGVSIAIDDFGTGYSSMEYLASLPCSTLKVDQQFFLNFHKNAKNHRIIEAIVALSHRLGLKVVAEGIEFSQLYDIAEKLECDRVQGYWIGAPEFACDNFDEFILASKERSKLLLKMAS